MNEYKYLSLIDSFYIIYMMNYFKTQYSIAHPLTYFENKFLYHPIGISKEPINNVCPLGHCLSYFLAFRVEPDLALIVYW